MKRTTVQCPVSHEKTNENVARIVAFFVITIISLGLYFKMPLVFLLLAIDFSLRAFTKGKYSPLKYISKKLSHYLKIPAKPVDAASKKFAAGLGLTFSVSIATLLWLNYTYTAGILASVLLLCAGLECIGGICFGCIIYTYIVLPFLSKENSEQSSISINL